MLAVESKQAQVDALRSVSEQVAVPASTEIDLRSMAGDLARANAQSALREADPHAVTVNNFLGRVADTIEAAVSRTLEPAEKIETDFAEATFFSPRITQVGAIAKDEVQRDLGGRAGIREVSKIESAAASIAEDSLNRNFEIEMDGGASPEGIKGASPQASGGRSLLGTRQEIFVLSELSLNGFESLANESTSATAAPRSERMQVPVPVVPTSALDELTVPEFSNAFRMKFDRSVASPVRQAVENAAAINLADESFSLSA